jgi:hypothetical protein
MNTERCRHLKFQPTTAASAVVVQIFLREAGASPIREYHFASRRKKELGGAR